MSDPPPVVKRGRGRPRKYPRPENGSTEPKKSGSPSVNTRNTAKIPESKTSTSQEPPEFEGFDPRLPRARKERKLYSDEWALGDDDIEGGTAYNIPEKLESDKYNTQFVREMKGTDFNIAYLQKYGFFMPVLFKDRSGLGLQVPNKSFNVRDVKNCVGSRRVLEVMDVITQKNIEMSMKDFLKYYENPQRDRLLNVISLEFSHTDLENYVRTPTIVRQIDWVETVWPRHLKEMQKESTNSVNEMMYPKVQKYCLMSVKGCYTDFHVDFGGTSVWYHILRGSKVFWLIPPTEKNIRQYEQWILSGKQSDIFFGDMVEKCGRVLLNEGDTFFIPTGWIHAVYTLKDSLVFGGNFLHSFGIDKQLRIVEAEDNTKVPQKYRYPFFVDMLWFVLEKYVYCILGKSHLRFPQAELEGRPVELIEGEPTMPEGAEEGAEPTTPLIPRVPVQQRGHIYLTPPELYGLKAIIRYVHMLPTSRKSIPYMIDDPVGLINDMRDLIEMHRNDNPDSAVNGRYVLLTYWEEEECMSFESPEFGNRSKQNKSKNSGANSLPRRRRTRCKKCRACLQSDCGECAYCHDMVKFGGPGKAKQTCIMRQCTQPMLPVTASCAICTLDGWGQQIVVPIQKVRSTPSSLMECSICFEIVHPDCIAEKIPDIEGSVNEDLPNSWECPRCCRDGKNTEVKPRHHRTRPKLNTNGESSRRASIGSDVSGCRKMEVDSSDASDSDSDQGSFGGTSTNMSHHNGAEQMSQNTSPMEIDTDNVKTEPFESKHREAHDSESKDDSDEESEEMQVDANHNGSADTSISLPAKKRKVDMKQESRDSSPARTSGPSTSRPSDDRSRKHPTSSHTSGPSTSGESRKVDLRTQIANHLNGTSNKILKRPLFPVRPAPPPKNTEIIENSSMPPYMSRTALMLVFQHLTPRDLVTCTLVCKAWSTIGTDPSLWKRIDVTSKRLTANCLSGIVRRQPQTLILDWTGIAKRQFEWLIARLPQLKELSLQGCSWSGVSPLRMCTCPPLVYLDLSYVSDLNDSALRDILLPPTDPRPGLVDTKSRLRNLKTLKLAGCDISDVSLRYITQHVPLLTTLDLSQCFRITDAGIAQLTTPPAPTISTLVSLDLSACSMITDKSIEHLTKCAALKHLVLRHTVLVTTTAIRRFKESKPGFIASSEKVLTCTL